MSSIKENIQKYRAELLNFNCKLIAVSKTKPNSDILDAYNSGQRVFGENKVQELTAKSEVLPKDIKWHMIGHLQSNKVKYIAPFIDLIHAVDSLKLLKEINKQALKNNRTINCLLQVHIAQEETKFGLSETELYKLIQSDEFNHLNHINVIGLMAMATNTDDHQIVLNEFNQVKSLFDKLSKLKSDNLNMQELSIGMSGDYKIALEAGSTMVRIGSAIFGQRNYN